MTDSWEVFKEGVKRDLKVEKGKTRLLEKPQENNTTPRKENTFNIRSVPKREFLSIPDKNSLERSLVKALKRASHSVDCFLDLHGYSLDKAFNNSFFAAVTSNLILLLIVTSKGDLEKNTIRANLLKWVQVPSIVKHILYFDYAPTKHGGEGAFYIYLRKT